jgi:transcriptional regulator with XRE-family HTH domain
MRSLRELRLAAGFTQLAAARLIDVDRTAVSRTERDIPCLSESKRAELVAGLAKAEERRARRAAVERLVDALVVEIGA